MKRLIDEDAGEKPKEPPKFFYEQKNEYGKSVRVYTDKKCYGSDLLGELSELKGEWRVAYGDRNYGRFGLLRFGSQEEAAAFLWLAKEEVERLAQERPLTSELEYYFRSRADTLRDRIKALTTELLHARHEIYSLGRFAEKYGIDQLYVRYDEVDPAATVKRLLEWKRQGDEYAFMSEATLYELLGKEDARTLLALTGNVVKHVSPIDESAL